jgi:Transcriptional Coactivator p15 (PC4)
MTRPTPTLSEPLVIDQWWQTRGGKAVRLTLSSYAGRTLIDLRTWYTADDGRLKPGKGAEAKHLPRLTAAFREAVATARELALIPDNDERDQ